MSSLNTPAHEIEWNANPLALRGRTAKKTLPQVECPWQGYEACRECELYGQCFKLEAKS